jgi:membrane protease YdiL (CAAX protease family)
LYAWSAIAMVIAYNPIANQVLPQALYVPANLLVAAALVWLASKSGATSDLMGLRSDHLRRGLAVGAVAAAFVAIVVIVLALLPWTRSYLADDRFLGVSGGRAMYEAMVRIPFGTALGEEIIFRGALLGLFLRRFTVGRAILVSSLLFGLWHILPAFDSLATNPAGDVLDSPIEVAGAVAGTVVSTAVAGAVFAMVRLRASSVAAPVVLHFGLNGSAYVAGWLLVSMGWAS